MDRSNEKENIDPQDTMKLINDDYRVKGIRLRAKAYVLLQALGLLSAFYLAYDLLDFVFDETKWLLIFIASIIYLFLAMALTLRIALKKELRISVVKLQLTLILIFDIIPSFILILVALNDIF